MGLRVHYYKNNFNKSLKVLIFENYSDFAQWYINRNESSIIEFGETYGTEQLIDFFTQNKSIGNNFDLLDKKLVDEMAAEFVGEYCGSNNLIDFFGPSINKSNYDESTRLVLKTKNDEFIRLWRYLIEGRSLKESERFDSYTNDYRIGFLSFKEHSKLKELMIKYFGYLKNEHSLNFQKEKPQNFKKETNSLLNYNFSSIGFESVMASLDEIKIIDTELIIGIE